MKETRTPYEPAKATVIPVECESVISTSVVETDYQDFGTNPFIKDFGGND